MVAKVGTQRHFERIDCLKGLGIIAMVLGHSGAPFTRWIYLFHMALFFLCSGYCWKDGHADNITSVVRYVRRKLGGLYIPYVVSNLIFVLMHNQFIHMGIYIDSSALAQLPGLGSVITPQAYFQSKDYLRESLKVIFFMGGTQMGGATWFIRTLFFISCGHCVWVHVINHCFLKKYRLVLQGALLLTCAALSMCNWPSEIIASFFPAYIAYYLGVLIRKYETEKAYDWLPGCAAIIVLCIMNPLGQIAMSKGDVTDPVYFLIVSLAGWVMLCSFTKLLTGKVRSIMQYLGQNTLPVVILHFLCIKLVTWFYLTVNEMEMAYLAAFPVVPDAPRYLWCVYMLIGTGLPLILNEVYKRLKQCVLKTVR